MTLRDADGTVQWWSYLLMGLCAALVIELVAHLLRPPPLLHQGAVVTSAPAPVVGKRPDLTAARAAAASREKAGEGGWLDLSTQPRVEVWLGERALGTTPLDGVALPSGAHTLEMKGDGAALQRKLVVEIRAGRTTVERLNLYSLTP